MFTGWPDDRRLSGRVATFLIESVNAVFASVSPSGQVLTKSVRGGGTVTAGRSLRIVEEQESALELLVRAGGCDRAPRRSVEHGGVDSRTESGAGWRLSGSEFGFADHRLG